MFRNRSETILCALIVVLLIGAAGKEAIAANPSIINFRAFMISPDILHVQGAVVDADAPVPGLRVYLGGVLQGEELIVVEEDGFFAWQYVFDVPPIGNVTAYTVDADGNSSNVVVKDIY